MPGPPGARDFALRKEISTVYTIQQLQIQQELKNTMDQNSKKLLLSATPAGSSNKIRDICVEKSGEVKRFVIPTEYLAHDLFGVLLREAEEEFGFQTEGILKIPCEFAVFEKILKAVQQQDGKRPPAPPQQPIFQLHDLGDLPNTSCYSPDAHAHHPAAGIPPQTQMCR
nr:auxin-responsive protein SAUR72-like [Ipomoea batatas]